MQMLNFATVTVDTTAGGGFILTSDEADRGTRHGMTSFVVNPSVDIVLVDSLGIAALVPGTVANSPWVCPAGVPTVIAHRNGPIKAISTSGVATVKRSVGF